MDDDGISLDPSFESSDNKSNSHGDAPHHAAEDVVLTGKAIRSEVNLKSLSASAEDRKKFDVSVERSGHPGRSSTLGKSYLLNKLNNFQRTPKSLERDGSTRTRMEKLDFLPEHSTRRPTSLLPS